MTFCDWREGGNLYLCQIQLLRVRRWYLIFPYSRGKGFGPFSTTGGKHSPKVTGRVYTVTGHDKAV